MSKKSLSRGGKGGLGASATVALMMLATVVAKGLGLFRQVLMADTPAIFRSAFCDSHIRLLYSCL